MRFVSLVTLGVLALSLSTVGCAADPAGDTAESANDLSMMPTERTATEADAGTVFQIVEGQDFVLRLGANATTGYAWRVTKTNRTFGYPSASVYESSGANGPIGALC